MAECKILNRCANSYVLIKETALATANSSHKPTFGNRTIFLEIFLDTFQTCKPQPYYGVQDSDFLP
eukprot:scaffold521930_cov19-Prasinocladus_malaysianus.AAC.1